MEMGLGADTAREGAEWDEYYAKELRRRGKGTRSVACLVGAVALGAGALLTLAAAALAREDESTAAAALRILTLG